MYSLKLLLTSLRLLVTVLESLSFYSSIFNMCPIFNRKFEFAFIIQFFLWCCNTSFSRFWYSLLWHGISFLGKGRYKSFIYFCYYYFTYCVEDQALILQGALANRIYYLLKLLKNTFPLPITGPFFLFSAFSFFLQIRPNHWLC